MKNSIPEFSSSQWEFVATLHALGEPVSIEVLEKIAPLSPARLLDIMHRGPVLGILEQPDFETFCISPGLTAPVIDRISEINTTERFAAILDTLQDSGSLNELNPLTRINLLECAGRSSETFLLVRDLAQKAIEDNEYVAGLQYLERAIHLLSSEVDDSAGKTMFIETVLEYSQLSYRLGKSLSNATRFLKQARKVAIQLGDRRSTILVSLHIGRFFHYHDRLEDALNMLSSAYHEIKEIDDDDIMRQSAEFLGLYYFIQGRYTEAAEHFTQAMHTVTLTDEKLFNYLIPIYLGYSTALMGQFHRAIGVLDCNWRRAQLNSESAIATHFRVVLGTVLLMTGKRKEALEHLEAAREEAVEEKNGRGLFLVQKGLAYYYLLEGHLEKSYELAVHNVIAAAPEQNFGPKYILQFVLEMLYAYKKAGFTPVPAFEFDHEIESAINGVNVHLKGVALRLRALNALAKNESPEVIQVLLEKSEEELVLSGDLTELARTRVELARMKLHAGDRDAALVLALQAREGLSAYGQAYFPDDLRSLLNIEASPSGDGVHNEEFLSRFMDMMDELIPGMEQGELFSRVIAATCRFFGAERGGLFLFTTRDGSEQPVLKAAYNLPHYDVDERDFSTSLSLIRRAYSNKKPLVVHSKQTKQLMTDKKIRSILCLPFEYKDQVHGVLYHENTYIEKSFDFLNQKLLMRLARHVSVYITRILNHSRPITTGDRNSLIQPVESHETEIVYRNELMAKVVQRADEVSKTSASVLILGETGTGKELVAQRIHAMSPRKDEAFVVVDPSSIPDNLVESELFGHEKGAFTGASHQRRGRMELAHKGTLFIDEVGDIPLAIQVKLLRALQEKSFSRIGGIRTITSDFRLVAATNRDLKEEVALGNFREDLYYRLNVVPVTLPPLRERGDDIILLAEYFLNKYARRNNRRHLTLQPEDKKNLKGHSWQGNIRELKNIMERAVILSTGDTLELPVLSSTTKGMSEFSFTDKPTLDELQRRYIRYVLKEVNGKMSGPGGAAEVLGMKRSTIYNRMKKLGLLD